MKHDPKCSLAVQACSETGRHVIMAHSVHSPSENLADRDRPGDSVPVIARAAWSERRAEMLPCRAEHGDDESMR